MSDPESLNDLLKSRRLPSKPKFENGITNPGIGRYALPRLIPKTPEQRLAFEVAGDFNLFDHMLFLLKWIHHFKVTAFRIMVGKVKERSKTIRDKGKYLNAIIKDELAQEELANDNKDCDNNSK